MGFNNAYFRELFPASNIRFFLKNFDNHKEQNKNFFRLLLKHPPALSDWSPLIAQGLPRPPFWGRNMRELLLLQKARKQEESGKRGQSTNTSALASALWDNRRRCTFWRQETCPPPALYLLIQLFSSHHPSSTPLRSEDASFISRSHVQTFPTKA